MAMALKNRHINVLQKLQIVCVLLCYGAQLASAVPCSTIDQDVDLELTISSACSFAADTVYVYKNITITNTGRVTMEDGTVLTSAESLILEKNGVIYAKKHIKIISNGTMEIRGTIDGSGGGYDSDNGPSVITRPSRSAFSGYGASHGGVGHGPYSAPDYGVYGSYILPKAMGSGGDKGGCSSAVGGKGGAAVHLKAFVTLIK